MDVFSRVEGEIFVVEQKIALIEEAIEEVAEYRQDKSMDVEERRFLRTTELQLRTAPQKGGTAPRTAPH